MIEQFASSGDLVKAVSVKATRCRLRVGLECACAAAPRIPPFESPNVTVRSTTSYGQVALTGRTVTRPSQPAIAMEESGFALRCAAMDGGVLPVCPEPTFYSVQPIGVIKWRRE